MSKSNVEFHDWLLKVFVACVLAFVVFLMFGCTNTAATPIIKKSVDTYCITADEVTKQLTRQKWDKELFPHIVRINCFKQQTKSQILQEKNDMENIPGLKLEDIRVTALTDTDIDTIVHGALTLMNDSQVTVIVELNSIPFLFMPEMSTTRLEHQIIKLRERFQLETSSNVISFNQKRIPLPF